MKLFKNIKRKVGNAIVPVVGSILGLTILAGAVVGVALNTSRIVYREDKLQRQNDARQILYIAAKYFCDQKNNDVDDSDIVAELQAIFGKGLKVTQNADGSYYVWYPNSYNDGSNEYKETLDSEGKYVSSNVSEWLKAKITLTQNDADDGSGNKDAELNKEMFREEAKIDEKFAIGNLMTVYMTDENLLPGRKWKLNEVSLVKSDIDTFDEAFTYFNNAGTLLIDDIGYALYAYKDITSGTGGGYTTIYELSDGKATYELVYSTDYIGGNYYWQNSNKVDTTTWIYKQEYDMEMLAGMLNLYYSRAHKTNSGDITDESTVYYKYDEPTGKHIIKASEDETDPEKIIECATNLEFAEKLSFYVFWVNMPRLCLKLNDFVEALLDTFDPDRNEARYEYIWTDKGLTVNAFHRGGNYWPYYFTMSQIEDILFGLGMSTEYKYVTPSLTTGTYSSLYSDPANNFNNPATTTIDGKEYRLVGYDVKPSNTYKGESYEVDIPGTNQKKTYQLFYTAGVNESADIKYFDSYMGDYFTYGGKTYKFDLANTGNNNPGNTKDSYMSSQCVIYSDTQIGTLQGSGSEAYYGYSKDFEYEGKNIHSEYRCYDVDAPYYGEKYLWRQYYAENPYTDENGNNYTLQDGYYTRCVGARYVDKEIEVTAFKGWFDPTPKQKDNVPSTDLLNYYDSNALSNVNDSQALYAQLTPISGNGNQNSNYYQYLRSYYESALGMYVYHFVYKIRYLVFDKYDYAISQGMQLAYQNGYVDTWSGGNHYQYPTFSLVESNFTGEYHEITGALSYELYNKEYGAYRKYITSEGKYRYYYFPQYAYRELQQDDGGPFYYGYAQYECTEPPEFDYEKMYSRLLSIKELDLSKQYSGGRELNNITFSQLQKIGNEVLTGNQPAANSQYRKLYDDMYQYAMDTLTELYTPTDGGVPSLLGDQFLVSKINRLEQLKLQPGSDDLIISFHVKYDRYKFENGEYTDEIEYNQDYYMEQSSVGVEPFTFTTEEFKTQFMEGVLKAFNKNNSALLDPDVQYTIKTRSEKEVLEDLVNPIRYQYLPTTKYYEIFGNTSNKQGFKEEQLYNKLLAFYFDSEEDDTIYKYKSVTYSTDSTYSNRIIIDITAQLYNSDNVQTTTKKIRFVVTPVTWNLINTDNVVNLIQDESGNYVLDGYKVDGDYKPVEIRDMQGNVLDLADLRDTSLPAILGVLPLKVREQKSSTPKYAKNNQKINVDGVAYNKISVRTFKSDEYLDSTTNTITISENTLVDGNVEFLAPSTENAADPYKNLKIVVENGCSLYINGTLNLRDNQDMQLGKNSLLFVNGSMFISYEYMGYLDKYSGNPQTATQINSSSEFGVQTSGDYDFYKNVGVDILAGADAKIVINGNLDYKGYKARYTRNTTLMRQVLSTAEWNAYSRISADKILYEQSVFNAHESIEDNQNEETGKWTHVTQECRSRLEGIYIINGDVKFRAWDEKNTTDDVTNATQQAVSMYRNCYSNPLVNATFYVDGAFDMRGLFVSGLYDLCRANFVFAKSIIQPSISLNTIYSKDNRSGLTNNPQGDNIYAGWGDTHGYLFIICEDAIDFSKANFGCVNIFTPYAEMLAAIENNGESQNNFTKYISKDEFKDNYPDKNVVNTWGLPSILKNGFEEMYSPNDIGAITTDPTFDAANEIIATKPKENDGN